MSVLSSLDATPDAVKPLAKRAASHQDLFDQPARLMG
jgi:hypothetical protein